MWSQKFLHLLLLSALNERELRQRTRLRVSELLEYTVADTRRRES